ncbi:MAG: SpoIID/LytB domain-containing protein [Candidatus Enterenecus sp.]
MKRKFVQIAALALAAALLASAGIAAAPADEPTEPVVEPNDPGVEPNDPGVEPNDPGVEPTDPGVEPTDPGTEPTDPGTEPTDPGTEPTDPGTEPTDPSTEPTEPVEPVAETPGMGDTIIRVGLYYSSTAKDGANISNAVGAGFRFGYYDSKNSFVPLADYTGGGTLSVVKTENVYYGTYDGYTSYYDHLTSSSVAVGCYHLQLDGEYSDYETAQAAAEQYSGGFVAYIGGSYYARVGNYLTRDDAVAAQEELAASGVSAALAGTSAYGVSVVLTGTNKIIFQYDDNGSGTGLGVVPIPSYEGEKCVTYFNVSYMNNNRWYGGFRYERIKGGDLTIVNMVTLDDYVKGVVPHEMSNSWPIEALKAQAVAARSYALSMLNRHSSYHFDICPTTHCQAYSGLSRAGSNSDAACDATAGVVATSNGSPASCFYYSSNGGASESSSVVWGSSQSKYPYLVGVVDPYEALVESSIPGYSWTRQYTAAQLTAQLNSKGYACSTIVSAKVTAYTDSGNPKTVTFTDSNGRSYTLTAAAMVSTFGFRSYHYDLVDETEGQSQITVNGDTQVDSLSGLYIIDGDGNVIPVSGDVYVITDAGVSQLETGGTVSGDVFTFSGKGWGHNVGMSQWGAYSMAKQGYTYDEILKFYYTGITVG